MQKRKTISRVMSMIVTVMMCFSLFTGGLALADTGESESAPPAVGGVYQIGAAEDLAWFAQEVNGGQRSINAALTADIDLSGITGWVPIGSASINSFTGSFNGGGYEINGMTIATGSNQGLFGYIGAGGTVFDLTISGSSVTGSNYLGLVAGSNAGTISGTVVVDSFVKGVQRIGGIAGENAATGVITGCANLSARIEQASNSDNGVGGIVGYTTGIVSLSYNNANISRTNGSSSYDGYFGGIAGHKDNTASIIDSCYNTGAVPAGYRSGGIAGNNNAGVITNSYNIGVVRKGVESSATYGGIAGTGAVSNTINCYYLDTCIGIEPDGAGSAHGTSKTDSEMKALAPGLGGAFDDDLSPQINDGYPILKWQNPDTEYAVILTVTPADATVSFAESDGVEITPDSSVAGVYIYGGLAAGAYEYAVYEDDGDYIPQTGGITVGYADVSKTIALEKRLYEVDFDVAPQDAVVSITEAGYEQSKTAASGSVSFDLPMGTYDYSVNRFGYIGQTGSVTVLKTDGTAPVSVTLTESAKHYLTFSVTPGDAVITVTHDTDGTQTPVSGATYNLYEGNTYSYTIRLSGYFTVKGSVVIGNSDDTIIIEMEEGIASWDGVTGTEPEQIDGVYQISDPEHLAWFRDKVNSDLVVATSGGNGTQITNNSTSSTRNAILLNDIDLGGYEWAPIGTFYVGNYNATGPVGYAGTFNGNGNAIIGLSITTGANGSGLFGVLMGGTVKDLTVCGNIRGGQYTGGIAGYCTGCATKYPAGTAISNCVSYVDITDAYTGSGHTFIGGITGYISNNTYDKEKGIIEYCIRAILAGTRAARAQATERRISEIRMYRSLIFRMEAG